MSLQLNHKVGFNNSMLQYLASPLRIYSERQWLNKPRFSSQALSIFSDNEKFIRDNDLCKQLYLEFIEFNEITR